MKIGIYGGTFSPPHNGHAAICREFIKRIDPDKMLIMPAGIPPHKKIDGGADAETRLEMCRAAFLPVSSRIEICEREVWMNTPSYTVDTLRSFSSEDELYLLCGGDMFMTLDGWREPEEIFRLCHLVCGARGDDPCEILWLRERAEMYRERFGARCTVMEYEPFPVSSTEVREAIGMGEVPFGICEGVWRIIQDRGLYGLKDADIISAEDTDALRLSVKSRMDEARYAHTLGVERMVRRLCPLYLPEDEEALAAAALLHDITRTETVEKQLQYLDEFGIIKNDFQNSTAALLHGVTAAALIPRDFPRFALQRVISAVRWHTTGREGMTIFETLVFLSDFIEETREYDDCVRLRDHFWNADPGSMGQRERLIHLWRMGAMCCELTVASLNKKNIPIDRNTLMCGDYFRKMSETYTTDVRNY